MANGLTARQASILDYIIQHINGNGYPPRLRDIGKAFGIGSTNGVSDHLRALERKGFIRRMYGRNMATSLKVLRRPDGTPVQLKFEQGEESDRDTLSLRLASAQARINELEMHTTFVERRSAELEKENESLHKAVESIRRVNGRR